MGLVLYPRIVLPEEQGLRQREKKVFQFHVKFPRIVLPEEQGLRHPLKSEPN